MTLSKIMMPRKTGSLCKGLELKSEVLTQSLH